MYVGLIAHFVVAQLMVPFSINFTLTHVIQYSCFGWKTCVLVRVNYIALALMMSIKYPTGVFEKVSTLSNC